MNCLLPGAIAQPSKKPLLFHYTTTIAANCRNYSPRVKRAYSPVTSKSDTPYQEKPKEIFYFETKDEQQREQSPMQKDINLPMAAVVNDIDALITEIDENPHLSSWVIRLVLKSIKQKAYKTVLENPTNITNINQTPNFDVLTNSSAITTTKIRTFR